jgi:hypothetical protein
MPDINMPAAPIKKDGVAVYAKQGGSAGFAWLSVGFERFRPGSLRREWRQLDDPWVTVGLQKTGVKMAKEPN